MLLRTTSVLCSAQHRSAHCTSQLTSTYALPRHNIRPKRSVSVAAIAAARDSSTCALHASASSVSDPELVQQGTPLHAAKIDSSYDAIVIGSGMGGLTAAVGLSKFGGQKVLVLEQHYTAGGFTGAFRRGKFAWNVGVHYIGGGVGKQGGRLFAPFNAFTDGKVAWAKLPYIRERIVVGDRSYDIATGREAWLEKLTESFPTERQALLAFLNQVDAADKAFWKANAARTMPGWLARLMTSFVCKDWIDIAGKPLSEVLDGLTENKELKAVLASAWPDTGLTPQRLSAGYYLFACAHYLDGAYIPAGGASNIPAAMIPAIEATGGAVVTAADVAQILVKGNKAVGVKLTNGRDIAAKVVISNAGLLNTYTHLLPPEVLSSTPVMRQQLDQAAAAGNSLGIAILYLGLNEPLVPEFKDLGTVRLYSSANHDKNLENFLANPQEPLPFMEICCCDAREEVMPDNPAGKAATTSAPGAARSDSSSRAVSTIQVMTFVNYEWFKDWADSKQHKRGEGYDGFKTHLKEKLMAKLGEVFPNLPERVVYSELSTPLTTEYFTRWPKGGIYGISMSHERYKLTAGRSWGPATPLPGLLLTGQDVSGDGVLAAFLTGTLAAQVAGGLGVGLKMKQEIDKWEALPTPDKQLQDLKVPGAALPGAG